MPSAYSSVLDLRLALVLTLSFSLALAANLRALIGLVALPGLFYDNRRVDVFTISRNLLTCWQCGERSNMIPKNELQDEAIEVERVASSKFAPSRTRRTTTQWREKKQR